MRFLKYSLLPLFLLCVAAPANAIVLKGLVSDVRDGETLVVMVNKRTLTVILKGVDAPELQQEFGNLARQHLASLILEKAVDVEFTELRAGNVFGKVMCSEMDIGLQVIRDGAAWYDRHTDHNLTDGDRQVYAEAEQVARNEQRGLWQDGSPMPPWEWRRRTQAAKSAVAATTYKKSRKTALGREDILFTAGGPAASTPGKSKEKVVLAKPSTKPLNSPGLDYDYRPYLNQGRVTIAYFYADWCPACGRMTPLMEEIHARIPDMQVLFLNIKEWNTPITQKHGVNFVPYLKVYDKTGNLVVEGKSARDWLHETLK